MNGESMLPSAQNKLLKTLEEPQEPAYIFIGTSNMESLAHGEVEVRSSRWSSSRKDFCLLQDYCPAGNNKVAAPSCGGWRGKSSRWR